VIGREGNSAWAKTSQQVQAMRGRTIRLTTKWPGTYSNSSLVHCPRTNGGQGLAIFAELLERTTTIAAGVAGRQYLFLAFKVVRPRGAIVGALDWGGFIHVVFGRRLLRIGGRFDLSVFLQIESQLIHGLGFGAETGLAMCGQFLLQLLDLIGLRLDLCRHHLADSAQFNGVVGQGFEGRMHAFFIPEQTAERNSKHAKTPYFIGLSSLQWPPCSLRHPPVNSFQQHRKLS
jgi:hypothetical protein